MPQDARHDAISAPSRGIRAEQESADPSLKGGTMPLTFRKSFRILPGVRLNINKRSWSLTTGGKNGPRHTHSSTGRRTTSMDLPGPFGWRRTRMAKRH
ncbi:hypothetical protein GCM10010129_65420 [Streptomyces fumigatiscleroticus]|nr:hypothetical protein GCM10010129_65420 [Streptomyces fumigatiscleroticus]